MRGHSHQRLKGGVPHPPHPQSHPWPGGPGPPVGTSSGQAATQAHPDFLDLVISCAPGTGSCVLVCWLMDSA